ncbi:MAG: hypothetical protein AVDCRST_MAG07-1579, partial [uncultured Frankineae bacterium]
DRLELLLPVRPAGGRGGAAGDHAHLPLGLLHLAPRRPQRAPPRPGACSRRLRAAGADHTHPHRRRRPDAARGPARRGHPLHGGRGRRRSGGRHRRPGLPGRRGARPRARPQL